MARAWTRLPVTAQRPHPLKISVRYTSAHLRHNCTQHTQALIHSFSHSVIQSFSHSVIQSFSQSVSQSHTTQRAQYGVSRVSHECTSTCA